MPFDREEKEAITDLRDHPFKDILAGTCPITFANGAAAQSESQDPD